MQGNLRFLAFGNEVLSKQILSFQPKAGDLNRGSNLEQQGGAPICGVGNCWLCGRG